MIVLLGVLWIRIRVGRSGAIGRIAMRVRRRRSKV